MIKSLSKLTVVCVLLLTQLGLAESTNYHLKRMEIQARAFLATMNSGQTPANPMVEAVDAATEASVDEMPQAEPVNAPTWAEKMVKEDLEKLISSSESLRERLENANTDEMLKAKVELESLARRLRVSTAPLELGPQDKANLELIMLELDEASAYLTNNRNQAIAQQDTRRRRSRVNVGVGVGWGGGWGGWGPWGPWGGGFYNPYFGRSVFVRRGFRRGYRRCR